MAIDPAWLNPTILGVLFVVLIGVGYGIREIIKLGGKYFGAASTRQEKSDAFFQDMIRARDSQHAAHVAAWERLARESAEATERFAEAMEHHETRAQDRHQVLMDSVMEQRKEAQKRFEKMVDFINGRRDN